VVEEGEQSTSTVPHPAPCIIRTERLSGGGKQIHRAFRLPVVEEGEVEARCERGVVVSPEPGAVSDLAMGDKVIYKCRSPLNVLKYTSDHSCY
jgi:hypothetical protein